MRWFILLTITAAILGAFGGYWYHDYKFHSIPDSWIEIPNVPTKGLGGGITYTSESLFNSDIPLPEIKSVTAKVKFIESTETPNKGVCIGYVVFIDVDNLDSSKIPAKYKREKKEKYKAGTFTFEPLKEVVYDIHMEFALLDKDGFELANVIGPKHSLYSGQKNTFQDKVVKIIPVNIAKCTAIVKLEVSVDKCLSCY